MADGKPRARRIASDEAHAWARNLRLRNHHAKYVLCMLTLYVNGEGFCFVSIDQLAEDTELSADTVRRRLAWLDSIGAIVRRPQFVDENGRRNGDGRGKRTTDEIRLMLDSDAEEIERSAAGKAESTVESVPEIGPCSQQGPSESSPRSEPGLNEICPSSLRGAPEPIGPRLALGQPSQGCEGLRVESSSESISEPESPPLTPPLGGCYANDFSEFEKAWAEPILRHSLAEQVFATLTAVERSLAVRAARGYVARRKSQKKPPNVINAHTFLREKGAWAKFATLAPDAPRQSEGKPRERVSLPDFTPEGHAFAVCQAIAGIYGNFTLFRDQIPTGAEALAALWRVNERGRVDTSDWVAVKSGTAQCVAWAERVKEWLKHFPDERRFWLNAAGDVVRTREEAFLPQGALAPASMKGLLVPRTETGFPPAKGSAPAPIPKARAGPSEEELEGAEF